MDTAIDLTTWQSHRTGKRIKIADMPDEYLQFTIAMIKRGYDSIGMRVEKNLDIWLPVLEEEAKRRGLVPKEDGWDE
jgi:hypothetical protein